RGHGLAGSIARSLPPPMHFGHATLIAMHAFSRRLRERPLLCDGGMGSFLYARGVELDPCFDALNLTQPRLVQSVHTEYIARGADIIETNTFGANRFKLAAFGFDDHVRRIHIQRAR